MQMKSAITGILIFLNNSMKTWSNGENEVSKPMFSCSKNLIK